MKQINASALIHCLQIDPYYGGKDSIVPLLVDDLAERYRDNKRLHDFLSEWSRKPCKSNQHAKYVRALCAMGRLPARIDGIDVDWLPTDFATKWNEDFDVDLKELRQVFVDDHFPVPAYLYPNDKDNSQNYIKADAQGFVPLEVATNQLKGAAETLPINSTNPGWLIWLRALSEKERGDWRVEQRRFPGSDGLQTFVQIESYADWALDRGYDIDRKAVAQLHPDVEFSAGWNEGERIAEINREIAELRSAKWETGEGILARDEKIAKLEAERDGTSCIESQGVDSEVSGPANQSVLKSTAPKIPPSELRVIIDDINELVTVISDRGTGAKTIYSSKDILGRGVVTWGLLVEFAKHNGSLEGDQRTELKKKNTSANRKNLGGKLKAALNLNQSPFVKGRNGVVKFCSIELAGAKRHIDALDRSRASDEQTTAYLERHGVSMPPLD